MSRATRSKWFGSGGVNVPPQRPPSVDQMRPSWAQRANGVTEAGWSPTRKSAAREGQRVWSEFGAAGLISACRNRDRQPEIMKRPGQRSPSAENLRAASASSLTSISARVELRIHLLERRQPSVPTRLDNPVLPERDRENPQRELAIERGRGARDGDENKLSSAAAGESQVDICGGFLATG